MRARHATTPGQRSTALVVFAALLGAAPLRVSAGGPKCFVDEEYRWAASTDGLELWARRFCMGKGTDYEFNTCARIINKSGRKRHFAVQFLTRCQNGSTHETWNGRTWWTFTLEPGAKNDKGDGFFWNMDCHSPCPAGVPPDRIGWRIRDLDAEREAKEAAAARELARRRADEERRAEEARREAARAEQQRSAEAQRRDLELRRSEAQRGAAAARQTEERRREEAAQLRREEEARRVQEIRDHYDRKAAAAQQLVQGVADIVLTLAEANRQAEAERQRRAEERERRYEEQQERIRQETEERERRAEEHRRELESSFGEVRCYGCASPGRGAPAPAAGAPLDAGDPCDDPVLRLANPGRCAARDEQRAGTAPAPLPRAQR